MILQVEAAKHQLMCPSLAFLSTASAWSASWLHLLHNKLHSRTFHQSSIWLWLALIKSFLLLFPAFKVISCLLESICEESWVTGVCSGASRVSFSIALPCIGRVICLSDLVTCPSFVALRSKVAWNKASLFFFFGTWFAWSRPRRTTAPVLFCFASESQRLQKTKRTVALSEKGPWPRSQPKALWKIPWE